MKKQTLIRQLAGFRGRAGLARSLAALVLLLACAACLEAREVGFIEDFSLAEDRSVPLEQLIPGTEDYYYYHSLHYQNTEQFDKVDQLLPLWVQRHNETPRVREIRHRQALLTYARRPDASLEYIRKQLGLEFNHQRVAVGQKPNLPTELDQERISRERLAQQAKARYKNLQGFEDEALEWLISTELDTERRRHLLERLRRPDYPGLVELVVADLRAPNTRGFGSLQIHTQLLLSQLEECLKQQPDLLNQNNFVNIYLAKLHPNDDVDWRHDRQQQEAYLERLWDFAKRLGPVHNSLKAHVLYHRLALDRSRGVYDKDRFMTYIRLPRNAPYINREYLQQDENRRFPANLNQDFSGQTALAVVGNDEPLVRDYLQHFFTEETTFDPYRPYIDNTYLKHLFAETKLVNGLGDPEQWYSDLPPALLQALKERVDLDFAATNRELFKADDPISLDLFIKNVRTLIVKVYEVNTWNFYRQELREVNTDINLDGLVANEESTFNYPEPPLRRVRRHFDFPGLNKAGVYVIDFIGNGKSSRVVVRKGKLRHLVETTTAGHLFTVLNDANQQLTDARLSLGGRVFEADAEGIITVPFSNQPGRQPIVLSHHGFSSLNFFQHEGESYELRAGIYVDREALLKHRLAQVAIRPNLVLNGVPVTLSVLEDVQLRITSTDHDGIQTTKEIKDFPLHEDRESTYEFRVPDRLSSITFQLLAKVKNLSRNEKQDLAASESFSLNQIAQTDKVEDLHLLRTEGRYVVEVLGKSGEIRRDRPVEFRLKHRDFQDEVVVSLQSDQQGWIHLGTLEGIERITANGPGGVSHVWPVNRGDLATYPQSLHGVAGQPLTLPFMHGDGKLAREQVSLLELRGETFVADRFAALALDKGLLRIQNLPPGDYDLLLKRHGQRMRIRLAEGQRQGDYVLGDYRQLEVRCDQRLQIETVQVDQEHLTVRLQNAGPFARVHVLATRYEPEYDVFDLLGRDVGAEPLVKWTPGLESLYLEGRSIGDEFQYIIDRRYAKRFPGNMLPRPSMLLNPWAIRKTDTSRELLREGEAFGARPDAPAEGADRSSGRAERELQETGGFSNLNFLSQASAVLLNLEADEQGVLRVERSQLGPHQYLRIVAIDPCGTVYRNLSLAEQPMEFEDLRLLAGLDPDRHYTQQKQISVVPGGESFTLADIASSRFESYDSLARVYSLYATLGNDPRLAEFGFILNWPQMDADEKRSKYSEYACHELNFFLMKKDPEFFQQVVVPYLANKKDRKFLDRWLLGEDLRDYLQPWSYQRLNIVERILLARRIEAEREYASRHVRHLYELLPPDVERFNRLFETALRGRSLETTDTLGLADAKQAVMLERRRSLANRDEALALDGLNGTLRQRLQEEAAKRVEMLQSKAGAAAPPAPAEPAKPGLAANARKAMEKSDKAYFERQAGRRASVEQLYRPLDKTQEWVETNYYKLPIEQQNAELVKVNSFWLDFALHDPSQPFLSTNMAEANANLTEMMFALAVLDLPFHSQEHATTFEEGQMQLAAGSPMIVYHEEVKPAGDVAQQTPILVSQNFFRHGDRYRFENNEKVDKYVTDEFLVHTVYGCQIVITNPTSTRQKLDVLVQIPVGAMPVLNGRYTHSLHIDLQPFNTQTLEYHFYFPADGKFAHYPVHVAKNEQLLASAEPFVFNVVESLSRIDRESWEYVSQNGTEQDVLDYLKANNLLRHDLEKIAFRMGDAGFFQRVTELLAQQHVYNHTLWSYGIKHNAVPQIRQFLKHADAFVQQSGLWLDSPLLTIDPVARNFYQHMEYRPLVNARTHPLGRRPQIFNDRLYEQYQRLLSVLSYQRSLDDEQLLAVTYYMLLQDRVEVAIRFFERVNPEHLETRLQYDYFAVYVDFYRQQLDQARQVAAKYADHPVDRWRNAFATARSQLNEVTGKPPEIVDAEDREQRQTQAASKQPSFDFLVEAGTVVLNYQNVERVQVNYYEMDVELLFSRNPFVQQFSGQFSFIRPNDSQAIELPAEASRFTFELPETLRTSNVLVEIVAEGQSKTQAYYSNSMAVQLIESYGQLRITDRKAGQPLPTVYVKVYARMKDGTVRFYKDGYTDIRGRFDYTSLSTNELEMVDRFALLMLSDEAGAVVREAEPPKQ